MAACPTPLLLAATHLLRFPLLQLRILLSLSLLCLLPALPRSLLATHFVIDLTVIMCSNNTCNPTGRVCAANPTANSALSPYKQMDQRRGGSVVQANTGKNCRSGAAINIERITRPPSCNPRWRRRPIHLYSVLWRKYTLQLQAERGG